MWPNADPHEVEVVRHSMDVKKEARMQSITILLKAFEPSLLCQAEEKILSRLPHILWSSSHVPNGSIRRLVDYSCLSACSELRSDLPNGGFSAIRLPQQSKVWTLHRSPHGHSKSRETLRLSKYKCLIRVCFSERSTQNHYAEPQAQADLSWLKQERGSTVSIPKVALWISQIPGLYGVQIQLRWKSSQPITSSKCSADAQVKSTS